MSCRGFRDAIDTAFHTVAAQVDGAEEKAIHKPGVEGLHVFLEGCLGDAPRNGCLLCHQGSANIAPLT